MWQPQEGRLQRDLKCYLRCTKRAAPHAHTGSYKSLFFCGHRVTSHANKIHKTSGIIAQFAYCTRIFRWIRTDFLQIFRKITSVWRRKETNTWLGAAGGSVSWLQVLSFDLLHLLVVYLLCLFFFLHLLLTSLFLFPLFFLVFFFFIFFFTSFHY